MFLIPVVAHAVFYSFRNLFCTPPSFPFSLRGLQKNTTSAFLTSCIIENAKDTGRRREDRKQKRGKSCDRFDTGILYIYFKIFLSKPGNRNMRSISFNLI